MAKNKRQSKTDSPKPAAASESLSATTQRASLSIAVMDAALEPAMNAVVEIERKMQEHITRAIEYVQTHFKDETERGIQELHKQNAEALAGLARFRYSMESFKECSKKGEEFREGFMDMTPTQIDEYLLSHSIDAAWLVGFTKDKAVKQKYMRAIAKRPRPRARGRSKWPPDVHKAARKVYDHAMKDYRNDPARFWRWKDFAPKCATAIMAETGLSITENQLRRFILPAKQYPRPK
jgi:hypothetical protein